MSYITMESSISSATTTLTNAERDQQIRQDVRELALRHKDSRRLSREVCRLLFYRYGETPNANRIYNLTRKGSLTTISEEVAGFWKGLREQTQAHIPCPGLATEAAERLGTFVTDLIADIEQRLNSQLEVHRKAVQDEARLARLELQTTREAFIAQQELHQREKAELQRSLEAAQEQGRDLQQQIAHEAAGAALLREELQAWQRRAETAQSQVQQTQAMFAQEVANLRNALASADARAAGAEQHALERIEEERKAGRLLAEKLQAHEKAAHTLQQRLEILNNSYLKVSEEAAELRGKLQVLQEERDRLVSGQQQGASSSDKLRRPASRRKR